ncbi:hypothetical protein K2X33_03660 [bacterium]|nr:hypothetical protein [bacterium]
MPGKSEKKLKKADPFKTRTSKVPAAKSNDTVTPSEEVKEAIDAFRDAQEQAKHFEGEAAMHKDTILSYADQEYVKRLMAGVEKSFKILGDETMVTYIVTDSSAGLTEEDVAEIEDRFGKDAAEDLVVRDYGSIRFDADVLAANYEAVVEALQVLPEETLSKLFKPMLMKAKPGAAEAAKKHAKNAAELRSLLKTLRMKNYIK